MITTRTLYPAGLVILLFLTTPLSHAQNGAHGETDPESEPITATIHIDQTGENIEDILYGMFMENLGNDVVGNIVDDGLLAELLDDRKFFYPVDNDPELDPVNLRRTMRQWRSMGPESSVRMDRSYPYAGNNRQG